MSQDLTVSLAIKLKQTNAKARIAEIGKKLQGLGDAAKTPVRHVEKLRSRLEKLRDAAKIKVARDMLGVRPFRDIQREIDKTNAAFQRLKASGQLSQKELAQAFLHSRNKITELKEQTNGWATSLGSLKKELASLAAGGAGLVKSISEAVTFEDALVDVRRAADLTQEETAVLGKEMMDLSERYGMAATGVAALAAEAGKTGIAKEDLLEFSRVAVTAAMNFDMLPEEAGSALSTLRNITKKNVSEMEAYVGAINMLGDSAAARERDIVETMLRGGSDVMQLGASAEQAAALATALLNTGATAEQAGTALRSLSEQLSLAISKPQSDSGKMLQALVGDVRAFAGRMRTDAAGAIKEVLTALSKLDAQSRTTAANALFGSGLDTTNIKKLVGNMDEYNRLMDLATKSNEEYKRSLEETTQLKLDSPRTQIDAMKKSWSNLATVIGNAFMPAVKWAVTELGALARTLRSTAEAAGPTLTRFAALIVILAPIALKFKTIYAILHTLLPPFLKVGGLASKAGVALKGAGTAAGIAGIAVRGFGLAINFALGPLGLLGIALSAGMLLWAKWGGAAGKAAREARAAANQMRQSIKDVRGMSVGQEKVDAAKEVVAAAKKNLFEQRAGKKIKEREMIAPGESIEIERTIVDQDAVHSSAQAFLEAQQALIQAENELQDLLAKQADENQKTALGTFEFQHRQLMGAVDTARALANEIEDYISQATAAGLKEDDPRVLEGLAVIKKKYAEQEKQSGSARSAEIKSIRTSLDTELSLLKDGLARQKQALDDQLEDKLVSVRDYYAKKTALEQQEIDAEINRAKALLAEQRRIASTGDQNQRASALGEISRLESELIILNNRRADAAVANARKAASAERELAETLEELKFKVAEELGTATDEDRRNAFLREHKDLMDRLKVNAGPAGEAWVNKLINVQVAKSRLEQIQEEIDKVMEANAREEQSIDAQINAGLITQLEGRKRIVDLHLQAAKAVEGYLPALREMAAIPGPLGDKARAALQNLKTQLVQLRSASSEVRRALRDGLQAGIEEGLLGLSRGTMNLREALLSLSQSVLDAMTRMAAENLAQMATTQIMGMLPGAQVADMKTGAAAVTASASALSMAGGTLVAGANAIKSAAATLTTAGAATTATAATKESKSWWETAKDAVSSIFGKISGFFTGKSAGPSAQAVQDESQAANLLTGHELSAVVGTNEPSFFDKLLSFFKGGPAPTEGMPDSAGGGFLSTISSFFGKIFSFFTGGSGAAAGAVPGATGGGLLSTISSFFGKVFSFFGGGAGAAAGVTGTAGAAGGGILSMIWAFFSKIFSFFSGGFLTAIPSFFGSIFSLFGGGFASGGYVSGPGTSTSDSIPARLSAGEYVIRADAVRRVGRNFLDNINGLKSMPAMANGTLAFADGGIVPNIEIPDRQPAQTNTTVDNAINLMLVDDPERIADAAFKTKQGQEAFMVMLSRDPAKIRSILGL